MKKKGLGILSNAVGVLYFRIRKGKRGLFLMQRKVLLSILIVLLFLINVDLYAEETVAIRLSWWGSQVRHDKTLAVISLFEEKNPNIDIQPIYTGWREYWDRMATFAAGGKLPDIMQHDYKYFTSYYDHNLLVDMDDYLDEILRISDVDESLLDSARIHGKLSGIPAGINTYTILYDPDKFAEAGLEEPNYDWNWDEYKEICRQLNNRLGIYAATSLPMATRNITGLEHYVRQHGQSLFSMSSKELGFTEDLFVEFYNMDLDLTDEGVFAPGELRLENHTIENDLIVNGRTVMAAYWTNQIVAISEAAGKPLKMLPFPQDKEQLQSGYYLKPSMYWTITKNSKHPDIAAKFIDFLINDIEANKIMDADRGIPISTIVRNEMEPLLDDTMGKMFDFIEYISLHSSIVDSPPPAQYNQVIEILDEVHYKILDGSQTPQEAYQELKTRTSSILDNN